MFGEIVANAWELLIDVVSDVFRGRRNYGLCDRYQLKSLNPPYFTFLLVGDHDASRPPIDGSLTELVYRAIGSGLDEPLDLAAAEAAQADGIAWQSNT